jgi:hypothetical protein
MKNESHDDFVLVDFIEPEDFILIKDPEIRALMMEREQNSKALEKRQSFKYVSSVSNDRSIINH